MKRILIVGGVAGGASAAARARRLSEEAEIVMFERGEFVSFANCGLPYHIGGISRIGMPCCCRHRRASSAGSTWMCGCFTTSSR